MTAIFLNCSTYPTHSGVGVQHACSGILADKMKQEQ